MIREGLLLAIVLISSVVTQLPAGASQPSFPAADWALTGVDTGIVYAGADCLSTCVSSPSNEWLVLSDHAGSSFEITYPWGTLSVWPASSNGIVIPPPSPSLVVQTGGNRTTLVAGDAVATATPGIVATLKPGAYDIRLGSIKSFFLTLPPADVPTDASVGLVVATPFLQFPIFRAAPFGGQDLSSPLPTHSLSLTSSLGGNQFSTQTSNQSVFIATAASDESSGPLMIVFPAHQVAVEHEAIRVDRLADEDPSRIDSTTQRKAVRLSNDMVFVIGSVDGADDLFVERQGIEQLLEAEYALLGIIEPCTTPTNLVLRHQAASPSDILALSVPTTNPMVHDISAPIQIPCDSHDD